MDLWTATKIIFQRWYAFLPALLLGLVAVVLVVGSVETEYRATGRVILLAPQVGEDQPITNPFLDFQGGLGTMVSAIETAALDQQMYLDAYDAGFRGDFSVTAPLDNAILWVEVDTDQGAPAAIEGVKTVTRLVQERSLRIQSEAGAPPEQSITMQQISSPVRAQEMNGSKVKVAIALTALAVFGAVAVALLIDGLVRHRTGKPSAVAERRERAARRKEDAAPAVVAVAPLAAAAARVQRPEALPAEREPDVREPDVREPAVAETAAVGSNAGTTKTDTAKTDTAKTDTARTDTSPAEPAKAEAAKSDTTRTETAKVDTARTDSRHNIGRGAPVKADVATRADADRPAAKGAPETNGTPDANGTADTDVAADANGALDTKSTADTKHTADANGTADAKSTPQTKGSPGPRGTPVPAGSSGSSGSSARREDAERTPKSIGGGSAEPIPAARQGGPNSDRRNGGPSIRKEGDRRQRRPGGQPVERP